jgi:DNA mismatch endonuclease (patch repair protein)
MENQRSRDTKPELLIRRLVHASGLRYRVDALLPIWGVRRRADLLFTRVRVAVFVDGCFWHGCPKHATAPKSNAAWWQAKIDRNIARDADTNRRLTKAGWQIVRIWEHTPADEAAEQIYRSVTGRRDVS